MLIKNQESLSRGVIFALLAALTLTLMNVIVKLISDTIPVYELIWFRFLISFILLLPIVLTSKTFSFKLEKPLKFLWRTIYALLGSALLFFAVQKTSLTQALLLANTTPLIVPILAFIMTQAKITKWGVLGIILGFIGVSIVLNPMHTTINLGAFLALSSAFFVGLAILQIRLLGKTMDTLPMLFYYFLISTILTAPFNAIKFVLPSSHTTWLLLLIIGVMGFIYQICSTLSYKLAPVRLTTPILYINVLLGGLFEWLIWHKVPTFSFLIGCIVIILGVAITLFFGNPTKKLTT